MSKTDPPLMLSNDDSKNFVPSVSDVMPHISGGSSYQSGPIPPSMPSSPPPPYPKEHNFTPNHPQQASYSSQYPPSAQGPGQSYSGMQQNYGSQYPDPQLQHQSSVNPQQQHGYPQRQGTLHQQQQFYPGQQQHSSIPQVPQAHGGMGYPQQHTRDITSSSGGEYQPMSQQQQQPSLQQQQPPQQQQMQPPLQQPLQQPIVYQPQTIIAMNTTTQSTAPAVVISSHVPVQVTCPYCNVAVITRVTETPGSTAYILAVVLCCVFWPLVWVPFVISGCLDKTHNCPNCNRILGTITA